MQISDNVLIEWIQGAAGAIASGIAVVAGIALKSERRRVNDYRKRIDDLEDYVNKNAMVATTRDEVREIAQNVKREVLIEVKEDQAMLLEAIAAGDRATAKRIDDIRSDIQSLTHVVIESLGGHRARPPD
jgi:hypothetical protein